uniref:Fatty acid desaturase domain-containing protein n=1 Tax=Acrobeloides nanus TaxID=290746 RepID=A0A914BY98_9BILA
MGARTNSISEVLYEEVAAVDTTEIIKLKATAQEEWKPIIVWRNVILFTALHIGAFIGLYQLIFQASFMTIIWTIICQVLSELSVTAGAHRLWAHRSYKARTPLKIFLMLTNCMALQNDIIEWARDHRCHHKWTDTDADPHNIERGFFFAHMGWLMTKKHPKLKEMGGKLDLTDLTSDPVLAFQRRHYLPLIGFFCFLFPALVAVYGWNESFFVAWYTACIFRYCSSLHVTWLINSAAHTFGYRPYDQNISPAENPWTSFTAIGEGGHNFHHTFPYDYRTSEMPLFLNFTRGFIDVCAKLGLAYDMKVVSKESAIEDRIENEEEELYELWTVLQINILDYLSANDQLETAEMESDEPEPSQTAMKPITYNFMDYCF